MDEQVGREAQYDVFAEEFADHAEGGFYNAHIDRPACLELLGDVTGQHVLDAACGPGLYARELERRGAKVSAFDQSAAMVELTRARAPEVDVRVHDSADPLHWLPDGSVDSALLALALEYVDDRVAALCELHRVLRPWGALVLSRLHPTGDWMRHGGSYFEVRVIEETWSKGWQLRYWLAPLEQTCEELHAAGFLIERLVEPRPAPEAADLRPEDYARLHREPTGFLAIRAVARPHPGGAPSGPPRR
nr:class I SAM-dependent methyltransferase [uncultured Pseudokineococcus sp.]